MYFLLLNVSVKMTKISFMKKVAMKKTWEKERAGYQELIAHHKNENLFRRNYSSNYSLSRDEVLERIERLDALIAAAKKEFDEYVDSRRGKRSL